MLIKTVAISADCGRYSAVRDCIKRILLYGAACFPFSPCQSTRQHRTQIVWVWWYWCHMTALRMKLGKLHMPPNQPTRVQCTVEPRLGYTQRIKILHVLASNRTLSRYLLTIIIFPLLYTYIFMSILASNCMLIWHTPPFSELSWKFIKGPLFVGHACLLT